MVQEISVLVEEICCIYDSCMDAKLSEVNLIRYKESDLDDRIIQEKNITLYRFCLEIINKQ